MHEAFLFLAPFIIKSIHLKTSYKPAVSFYCLLLNDARLLCLIIYSGHQFIVPE